MPLFVAATLAVGVVGVGFVVSLVVVVDAARAIFFRQLLGGTLAIEYQVVQYMREKRLFGFGRQSRLDRALMEAADRFSKPWRIAAGVAVLVVAIGVGSAAAARRRGGGRISAAGFAGR